MSGYSRYRSLLPVVFFTIFVSCIGTDIVVDSISRLEISAEAGFVNLGESVQLSAMAVNEFGDEFDVPVVWSSSNMSVATVDEGGILTGLAVGQTTVTASFEGSTSNAVRINVVDESSTVAYVTVTAPGMRLEVGEMMALTAAAYNPDGDRLEEVTVEWTSSDETVVTVGGNGEALAVGNGTADVTATVDGVSSDPFTIVVGGETGVRTGSFVGKGGYSVMGDVRVSMLDANTLQVSLQENFSSANGPGLWVYLSNFDNTVNGGVELMPLASTSGASSYTASGVSVDDYRYVVILCKPFNVVFGVADLN